MSQNTSPGCRAVTEQSTYRLTQNGLCLVTLEQVSENRLRDPTDGPHLGNGASRTSWHSLHAPCGPASGRHKTVLRYKGGSGCYW